MSPSENLLASILLPTLILVLIVMWFLGAFEPNSMRLRKVWRLCAQPQ
jgi:hypothetical protein